MVSINQILQYVLGYRSAHSLILRLLVNDVEQTHTHHTPATHLFLLFLPNVHVNHALRHI